MTKINARFFQNIRNYKKMQFASLFSGWAVNQKAYLKENLKKFLDMEGDLEVRIFHMLDAIQFISLM